MDGAIEAPDPDEHPAGAEPGTDDAVEDVVVQRLDGFPARLHRRADGAYDLVAPDGGRLPTLRPGERLRVTRPVRGDATYVQPARVLRVEGHASAEISPRAGTSREQQRRFARVTTQPYEVVLVLEDEGRAAETHGEMRDVSAGGARTVVPDGAEPPVGAGLRVAFSLPRTTLGDLDVDVEAEVVWAGTLDDGRVAVALEFADTDEATEAALSQWVFRTQTRRG